MDSEESRPGSSASNSSSSSSDDNSRPSSPLQGGELVGPKSPPPIDRSPASDSGRRSRPRSRSSIGDDEAIKSNTNSLSSSSSDNELDTKSKSPQSVGNRKASSDRSSSEDSSPVKLGTMNSRNGSVSPVKSPASSRHSSLSSNGSDDADGEGDRRRAECDTNISNDLSDVSDLESEKHVSSFNSKQSLDDEGTTNSVLAAHSNATDEVGDVAAHNQDDAMSEALITDLRQKLDQKKSQQKSKELNEDSDEVSHNKPPNGNNAAITVALDDLKAHDEDALDFEAEEGECPEVISKLDEKKDSHKDVAADKVPVKDGDKSDGEAEDGEELEEGEVSDEDEKRPEETEPKPVCRFYTRGQCTWGMSCRFLHPGVTDKGNYTMFDLVRPVPVPQPGPPSRSASYAAAPHSADYHEYRNERPPPPHHRALHAPPSASYAAGTHHEPRTLLPDGPVVVESAWERGLRTAKEMMRKANKRKEQDMDFEDKKMNLTLSPDELEKDPYYLKERPASPNVVVPPYGRHAGYPEVPPAIYDRLDDRFSRHAPVPPPYDEVDPYGRTTRYRELPPHRMPQYEDERRVRPTREVIVQRVDHPGRGDEWNDPWMRSKSPGARGISREGGVIVGSGEKRRRDHRSYSSNSSYSSSSSSQSDSSSDSSHSPSATDHRRRYNSGTHKASPTVRRHGAKVVRSPSPLPRHSRHSPTMRFSPMSKRRGHMSPSPAMGRVGAYSPPANKRKKISPNSKKGLVEKGKKRHRMSSSSASGSSDTSGSESDSDTASSTSGSSSRSRTRTPLKRGRQPDKSLNDKKLNKREPPKKRSPISIEIKKQNIVGTSALASPTHSASSEKDAKKSRREELLKQLRAVEDAIAKKRSKLS